MKSYRYAGITILLAAFVAILWMLGAIPAQADEGYPDGVVVFEVSDHICVMSDSGLQCFCPCEECYNVSPSGENTVSNETPDDPPDVTPVPSEEPKPTEKASCNRGIGNGSENCDPGNSAGQGKGDGRKAGEDRDE